MRDLQFIVLSDSLGISSIVELPAESTRTIKISSSGNFTYAKKVTVNDFTVSDFTVVSRSEIHARLPASFNSVPVTDMNVVVFSSQLTSRGRALVEYDLTTTFTGVSGTQKLAQQVIKTLITTAQTNRFDSLEGGSLVKSISGAISPENSASLSAELARAVADTKEFFTSRQATTRLPASEKLLNLSLTSLDFDTTTLEVTASVRMVTFSGESEILPITL